MKPVKSFLILLPIIIFVLSACGAGNIQPTPTTVPSPTVILPTIPSPTSTPTLEPTLTPTNEPTSTPEPTATATLIPFVGFTNMFRFYRTWYDNDKTVFYFLNAGLDNTIYAKIGEHTLECAVEVIGMPTPNALKCVSQDRIEQDKKNPIKMTFFADPALKQMVYEYEFAIARGPEAVYYTGNDCPARGTNVWCETEYRQYASTCTTSLTCYDACGYYYSFDNIPAGLDEPWTPTVYCP